MLPGGFSHGDYLRPGAMAAQSPVMRAVRDFSARGGYVLGVCNGFQILTEAGILPGALLRNAGLRFLSMDCHLRVERADTVFASRYRIAVPCSAARWRMATATISPMTGRWTGWRARAWSRSATPPPAGEITPAANRNGSARNIAGILSANLRVLGLMPHPENVTDKTDRRHRRPPVVRWTCRRPHPTFTGMNMPDQAAERAPALAREFGLSAEEYEKVLEIMGRVPSPWPSSACSA